jgi:hypothetical protein
MLSTPTHAGEPDWIAQLCAAYPLAITTVKGRLPPGWNFEGDAKEMGMVCGLEDEDEVKGAISCKRPAWVVVQGSGPAEGGEVPDVVQNCQTSFLGFMQFYDDEKGGYEARCGFLGSAGSVFRFVRIYVRMEETAIYERCPFLGQHPRRFIKVISHMDPPEETGHASAVFQFANPRAELGEICRANGAGVLQRWCTFPSEVFLVYNITHAPAILPNEIVDAQAVGLTFDTFMRGDGRVDPVGRPVVVVVDIPEVYMPIINGKDDADSLAAAILKLHPDFVCFPDEYFDDDATCRFFSTAFRRTPASEEYRCIRSYNNGFDAHPSTCVFALKSKYASVPSVQTFTVGRVIY